MNYFLNKTKRIQKRKKPEINQAVRLQQVQSDIQDNVDTYPSFVWDKYFSPIRLSLTLQDGIDVNDPTLAWACYMPSVSTAVKSTFLTIRKGTFMRRYQHYEYVPKNIHLCCEGVIGYFDMNGIATSKVARFAAVSLSYEQQEQTSGDITTFQLVTYKLEADTWAQIPRIVGALKMRFKEDNSEDYCLIPLQSPISMQINISRKIDRNLMCGQEEYK